MLIFLSIKFCRANTLISRYRHVAQYTWILFTSYSHDVYKATL